MRPHAAAFTDAAMSIRNRVACLVGKQRGVRARAFQ